MLAGRGSAESQRGRREQAAARARARAGRPPPRREAPDACARAAGLPPLLLWLLGGMCPAVRLRGRSGERGGAPCTAARKASRYVSAGLVAPRPRELSVAAAAAGGTAAMAAADAPRRGGAAERRAPARRGGFGRSTCSPDDIRILADRSQRCAAPRSHHGRDEGGKEGTCQVAQVARRREEAQGGQGQGGHQSQGGPRGGRRGRRHGGALWLLRRTSRTLGAGRAGRGTLACMAGAPRAGSQHVAESSGCRRTAH